MTDRIALLCENNRTVTRGLKQVSDAEFSAFQRINDTFDYTFDHSGWLGSDTIASVSRTTAGTTLSLTSNTTTQTVQSLHGLGYVDIEVTTTAGRIRRDRITILPRHADGALYDPYRFGWGGLGYGY